MTRAPKALRYPLPSSGSDNWKARAEAAENLLADRSTELDWERSARQAAEKEVERERTMRITAAGERGDAYAKLNAAEAERDKLAEEVERLTTSADATEARYARLLSNAEAKLAALVEAMRQIRQSSMPGSWFWNAADEALSALPPPRMAYRPACRTCGSLHTEEELHAAGYISCCPERDTSPTQALDVAGLVEALRLADQQVTTMRAQMYRAAEMIEERDRARAKINASNVRAWVTPTIEDANRHAILSALRASPISHEIRGLVLAAADNNHKALVERVRRILRNGDLHPETRLVDALDCLATFQSRQEGNQPEAEAEEDRLRAEDDDLMPGGFQ